MQRARLGVNIDHVATLRQARGEQYPSLVLAAESCLKAGADQITIHLREDRRHIQDLDLAPIKLVTQSSGIPLNLEVGCNEEILEIAADTKPEWICLVPEKREEKTTEGGLNLITEKSINKIVQSIEYLRENTPNSKISLFVEANEDILQKCIELKVDAVEIHTGDFAQAVLDGEDTSNYIEKFKKYKKRMEEKDIGYHAGHGLTPESLKPLVENDLFSEYNIGHWIICESVFYGLENVTKKIINILNKDL